MQQLRDQVQTTIPEQSNPRKFRSEDTSQACDEEECRKEGDSHESTCEAWPSEEYPGNRSHNPEIERESVATKKQSAKKTAVPAKKDHGEVHTNQGSGCGEGTHAQDDKTQVIRRWQSRWRFHPSRLGRSSIC